VFKKKDIEQSLQPDLPFVTVCANRFALYAQTAPIRYAERAAQVKQMLEPTYLELILQKQMGN
jgi:hypothetical protein